MESLSIGTLFGLLAGLLLVSACFSASETAMMAINRYRLRHAAESGHRGAILTQSLLNQTDKLLGVILLLPAIWFSWKTVDGLAARRLIRTDLAEITHARYGILSADQWRAILGPMLSAQVDKLDLRITEPRKAGHSHG